MQFIKTKSLTELKHEATKLTSTLRGGEMIGLIGPLGAGKTTFVQFAAEALGVKQPITSPTFTLLQIYPMATSGIESRTSNFEFRFLIHIDCYRLSDTNPEQAWQELLSIGLEDWLDRKDAIIMIEWADRLPNAIQKKMTLISLEHE